MHRCHETVLETALNFVKLHFKFQMFKIVRFHLNGEAFPRDISIKDALLEKLMLGAINDKNYSSDMSLLLTVARIDRD